MDLKKLITSKKGLIALLIFFLLTMIVVIWFFFRDKKVAIEDKTTARLTETYNKDMQNKDELPEKEEIMEFVDSETSEIEVVYETPKKESKGLRFPVAADNLDKELKKEVEKTMVKVSSMINESKIEDIRDMFNQEYLKEFNVRDEVFTDMFTFVNPVKPIVSNITEISDDRYIATIRFKDEFGWEKIFDFTIFEDGTIADIPIYGETDLNDVAKKDNVTYTIKKQVDTRQGTIFFLNIINNSEKVLVVKNMYSNSGNLTFNYENISYFYNPEFEVLPGIDTNLIIKIPNTSSPEDIILVTDNEGTTEEFSIWGNNVVNE